MAEESKKKRKTTRIIAPQPLEYYVMMNTDKDRVKFIKRTERLIRASNEYRDYINYLKENVDMNHCAFYQNICNQKGNRKRISIEIHHEPFTLYDYVDLVVAKFEEEGIPLNDLLVGDEVLKLHYENKVGLIPLSKTVHQAYHSGTSKIFIPLNMCYGDYKAFLEEYGDYNEERSERLFETLSEKIEKTKNVTEETFKALQKEFEYVDVKGYETPGKMEVEEAMLA